MKILATLLIAMTLAFVSPVRAQNNNKAVAPAAPAAVQTATKQAPSSGVWAVRCDDPKTGKSKHCEAFQRLLITKKGSKEPKRLVEFAIGYKTDGKKKDDVAGILILPLGVLVTDPVDIEIDEKKDFTAQIRYCDSNGCYAFADIPAAMMEKMVKGNKLVVKARAANGHNVHIVMSLAGLGAALEKIKTP